MFTKFKRRRAAKRFRHNIYLLNHTTTYRSEFLKRNILCRSGGTGLQEKIIKSLVYMALRIAIPRDKWGNKVKDRRVVNAGFSRITSVDFIAFPPSFAFALFMAFIPVVSIVFLVIGSNSLISNQMSRLLQTLFHTNVNPVVTPHIFLRDFVKNPLSAITFVLVLFVSVWIAAAGFSRFVFSNSVIYKHTKFGGFWMNRFRGMIIVLWFSLYLASLLVVVSGVNLVITDWHPARQFLWLKSVVEWVLLITTVTAGFYFGFGLLFKFAPRFKLSWHQVHPGAVVATVPTVLFLFTFNLITGITIRYSATGGTVAAMMTIATFMLVVSYFVYVGVIANAAFYEAHVGKVTKRKFTISRK